MSSGFVFEFKLEKEWLKLRMEICDCALIWNIKSIYVF